MNPSLASLIYACGIAGLFYLDRDNSVRTSKALWLPVIYLWIVGSRPVSFWLGTPPPSGFNTQLEGSPIDGAFFEILLIAAIGVLIHRGRRVLTFLNTNLPILLYFFFCLFSVIWSDYPGPALKKWIKSIGDLAMILIVLTDEQPVGALRRLLSRMGFILLPISLLFIKYYPNLGRSYEQWTGMQMVTGVTLDKNFLGLIAFVLSLGAVWRVLALLQSDRNLLDRRRHLIAQGALLVIGAWLLTIANSVTSLVSFLLGAGLLVMVTRDFVRRSPAAVHVLILSLALGASMVLLLGGGASAAHALGRNANLTGRTDIWATVIPLAGNPVVGAGFESFWLSPHVHEMLWERFPGLPLNEAHDGYIEVYLNLGWVGVSLIALILTDAYRRAVKAFRREPALASLLIAYIFSAVVYNITEAGFRMLDAMWIFFLFSVMGASIIASGVPLRDVQPLDAPMERRKDLPANNALAIGPRRTNYRWKIAR